MRVCIQDPASSATYLIDEADLAPFETDPDDYTVSVDVLLVIPTDDLVQELPSSRLSDSSTPSLQIVNPDSNLSWVLPHESLQRFEVAVPPTDGDDIVWFAMPTARELAAAVPVFRKALVQHSS